MTELEKALGDMRNRLRPDIVNDVSIKPERSKYLEESERLQNEARAMIERWMYEHSKDYRKA